MATKEAHEREGMKFDNLSKSQQESAYFNMQSSYDPLVYETDAKTFFQIVAMLLLFYVFNALHWFACFNLGVSNTEVFMFYCIIIFITAILVIATMLCLGATVNKKKITHDYYAEKISEERVRQAEQQAKMAAKAAHEAKKLTSAWDSIT